MLRKEGCVQTNIFCRFEPGHRWFPDREKGTSNGAKNPTRPTRVLRKQETHKQTNTETTVPQANDLRC